MFDDCTANFSENLPVLQRALARVSILPPTAGAGDGQEGEVEGVGVEDAARTAVLVI